MASFWTPKDYTPFFLINEPTHSPREIRAEYSRLRDIAVKRAKRLIKKGLVAQGEYLLESFPTLAEMQRQIESIKEENKNLPKKKQKRVPRIENFLARGRELLLDPAYSIKGIENLQKHIQKETGELVPLGEVLEFNDYMKSWRLSAFSKTLVTSEQAVELHGGEYQDVGGSFSNFYTLYQQM